MKLGEFIKNFSHNNIIRLVYKNKGGHEIVLENWGDVSMDWEVNKAKGKNWAYRDWETNMMYYDALNYIQRNLISPEYANYILQPHLERGGDRVNIVKNNS